MNKNNSNDSTDPGGPLAGGPQDHPQTCMEDLQAQELQLREAFHAEINAIGQEGWAARNANSSSRIDLEYRFFQRLTMLRRNIEERLNLQDLQLNMLAGEENELQRQGVNDKDQGLVDIRQQRGWIIDSRHGFLGALQRLLDWQRDQVKEVVRLASSSLPSQAWVAGGLRQYFEKAREHHELLVARISTMAITMATLPSPATPAVTDICSIRDPSTI